MIDLNEVLTQIEADRLWRESELRRLERPIVFEMNIDHSIKIMETKPLILFLYAHFEGHAKLIFSIYADTLNGFNLKCKNIAFPLIASSLNSEFSALKNPEKKHHLFPDSYEPEFKELGRRIEFFQNIESILNQNLKLDVYKIVDTESNLKPKVLKKILFRLGFDPLEINDREYDDLQKLLKWRNNIAHGAQREGFTYNEYAKIKESIFSMLDRIKSVIIDYLDNRKYLRHSLIDI